MLTECVSCQEPLTEDARLCPKCGAANPFYERKKPAPLAMTLLVLCGVALVLAVPSAVRPYLSAEGRLFLERAFVVAYGGGLAGLGAFGVIGNLRRLGTRRRVLAEGKRAIGTISRSIVRQSSSDRESDDAADCSPMIRFISDSGTSIEFEAAPERLYRWSRDYWSRLHRDGARVDVAYDPLDPSKAFVVGRPDPQTSWAIAYSVVFVISGVLILVTQFPR